MSDIAKEGSLLAGTAHDAAGREGRPPHALIASDRVEGTDVFSPSGERIGTVRRFHVDKRSGKAEYAELEFGGFLGIGKDTHPLPWEMLDYDVERGGYVIDLTKEQLHSAPRHDGGGRQIDEAYAADIRRYYGLSLLP